MIVIFMKKDYLAIDVGGTNIKYGILDHSGILLFNDKVPSNCHCLDEFYQILDKIIRPNLKRIKGIAVSVPGKVDVRTGTVYFGGALPFLNGATIKKTLEDKYHILVGVENDGKSAALAELWLGSLNDVSNSAVIVLGTMVGGGIILDHHLIRGSHFQAGEISFVLDHFRSSGSGQNTIIGNTCSAVKMIEQIATTLDLPDKKDGKRVFEEIIHGNPQAVEIFENYCYQVAQLIMDLQAVIDVEKVAIGGGVSAEMILIREINRQYDKLMLANPVLSKTFTRPKLVQAKFRNSANLYGALYALLTQYDKKHNQVDEELNLIR